MQQNAYYPHAACEDFLPCYCYAIQTKSRTIRAQLSQPASAGKVAHMSELQAYHYMTPQM